jgi:hypothetical protein
MLTIAVLLFRIAQEGEATDYDETLLIPGLALGAIALIYAAISAWIVTPKLKH